MLQYERQQEILAYLELHQSARMRDLAAAVYASEASVRRDIAALEAAIEENQAAQMAAGSDFTKLQELTEALAKLEAELEYKTERWMYLTELKEKIDAQGK